MLFFVQIPITDIRQFVEGETGQLVLPLWPTPTPYKEFIRNFGMVKRRGKGGISGWIGENEICNASHAIRFYPSINSIIKNTAQNFQEEYFNIQCVSRHFYFDGYSTAKLEIVFKTNPQYLELSKDNYNKCIRFILNLLVKIGKNSEYPVTTKLINSAGPLSKYYLQSTTKHIEIKKINNKWAIPGEIIVWSEANYHDSLILNNSSSRLYNDENLDFDLHHWWLPVTSNSVNIWHINCFSNSMKTQQIKRNLRILLMRLHSEQSSLRNVLKAFCTNDIRFNDRDLTNNEYFSLFQQYLNESTRRLFRTANLVENYCEPPLESEIIRNSYEQINPGQFESLSQKLKILNIRPQLTKKIQKYVKIINKGVITMPKYSIGQAGAVGDNAHAENIVFNQIWNQIEDQIDFNQLTEELHQLKLAMENMASTDEQKLSLSAISIAEKASKEKNGPKIIENLKIAGKWALDVATKIGVPILVEMLKTSLGFG